MSGVLHIHTDKAKPCVYQADPAKRLKMLQQALVRVYIRSIKSKGLIFFG